MKNKHTLFLLCLVVAMLWAVTTAAALHDDGQFRLILPDDWHSQTTVASFTRAFFAAPEPITMDASPDGAGYDALLTVTASLVPLWLQDDTLTLLTRTVQDGYRQLAHTEGKSFAIVAEPEHVGMEGLPAVRFTMQTGDTTRHTLLTVRDNYMFRVEAAIYGPYLETYETVMLDMMASFEPKGAPNVRLLQPRTTNVAVLPLPPAWHVKHHERHQSFVSKEKVEHVDDVFYTGVTVFAIANYAAWANLPFPSADLMYQAWLDVMLTQLEEDNPPGVALKVWLAPVDGRESLFVESIITDDDGKAIHILQVATVKDNHFFVGIFEAPLEEFYRYRPMYLQSINKLRWVVPR